MWSSRSDVSLSTAFSGYPGEVISVLLVATGGKAPLIQGVLRRVAGGLDDLWHTFSGTLTTEATFSGAIDSGRSANANTNYVSFDSMTAVGLPLLSLALLHRDPPDTTYGGFVGIQEFQLRDAAGALIPLTAKAASVQPLARRVTPSTPNANDGAPPRRASRGPRSTERTAPWWQVDMGAITPVPSTYHIWACRPTYHAQSPAEVLDVPGFQRWHHVGHARHFDHSTTRTGTAISSAADFVLPGKTAAPFTVLVFHSSRTSRAPTARPRGRRRSCCGPGRSTATRNSAPHHRLFPAHLQCVAPSTARETTSSPRGCQHIPPANEVLLYRDVHQVGRARQRRHLPVENRHSSPTTSGPVRAGFRRNLVFCRCTHRHRQHGHRVGADRRHCLSPRGLVSPRRHAVLVDGWHRYAPHSGVLGPLRHGRGTLAWPLLLGVVHATERPRGRDAHRAR